MFQIVLLTRPKLFSITRLIFVLLVCLAAAMPGPWNLPGIDVTVLAQQTPRQTPIAFPAKIQWSKQRGVTKYRFQIAEDERFSSIFYDGPVSGEHYVVTGLAPGYYYWRIAPSGSQSGAFARPVRFFVSGGVVVPKMVPVPLTPRSRLQTAAKVR